MTPRQAVVSATVSLLIALAILAEWAALPASLGAAEIKEVTVSATFRAGKGGRTVLALPSGSRAEVHCGRAAPLCQHVQSQAVPGVRVRLARVGLLDDVWLVSAAVEGRELLQRSELEQAYLRSRVMHLVLAGVFLLAAFLFAGYGRVSRAAAVPSAR